MKFHENVFADSVMNRKKFMLRASGCVIFITSLLDIKLISEKSHRFDVAKMDLNLEKFKI